MAKALPGLPKDAVEATLVTFETLVHFGDPGVRPEAALLLEQAAAEAKDQWCHERLLKAAEAVLAEQPLALTPDGKTWQQAAAAQTIGIEDWVEPPEPVYAEVPPEKEEEEEEQYEVEDLKPEPETEPDEEDEDDE